MQPAICGPCMSHTRPSQNGFAYATPTVALVCAARLARQSVTLLSRKSICLLFCSGALFFALVGYGPAATLTWSGGGASDDTSLGANWGATAPVAGDLLHFAGSVRLTPNQVAALSIGSLTFDSGAGAFTLGGNTYTITTASGVIN